MLQHVVDLGDGDLNTYINVIEKDGKKSTNWKEEEIKLNDYQVLAVDTLAKKMTLLMGDALTEKGNWLDSAISSRSAKKIFNMAHRSDFFDQFKDVKTPEEFTSKYDEKVKPLIEEAINEHALQKYRNRLMEIESELRSDVLK